MKFHNLKKSMNRKLPNRPLLLKGPYFAKRDENLMKEVGDVAIARQRILHERTANLDFLLRSRFDWMKDYLRSDSRIVEFGSGAGYTRLFIDHKGLIVTDVVAHPWIDVVADAHFPPFSPESVDCVICNQVLHHFSKPSVFLDRIAEIIRPGGYLLINEPESSFFLRLILRSLRHEGWSYEIDPFDRDSICVETDNPWSGNAAVANVLFSDPLKFETLFPQYKIQRNELCEFLVFLLSGGVTAKTLTLPLPRVAIKLASLVDRAMISLFPSLFALGRRVVLQRI
jgi:SAM-dependent methyltransferase